MIGDIVLVVWICVCFNFCWHKISRQSREIDDLKAKILQVKQKANERHFLYFILKEKTRDLENRISFIEAHGENEKARSALPEAASESYKI